MENERRNDSNMSWTETGRSEIELKEVEEEKSEQRKKKKKKQRTSTTLKNDI